MIHEPPADKEKKRSWGGASAASSSSDDRDAKSSPGEDLEIALRVLEHWREKLNPSWRLITSAQISIVLARLADGLTEDELRAAVDGAEHTPWPSHLLVHRTTVRSVFRDADRVLAMGKNAQRRSGQGSPARFQGGGLDAGRSAELEGSTPPKSGPRLSVVRDGFQVGEAEITALFLALQNPTGERVIRGSV